MVKQRRSTKPIKRKSPTPELSSSDGVAGSDDEGEFVVDAVVDHMTYKEVIKKFPYRCNGFSPDCYLQKIHCKYVFRVKWLNYGPASDTWEVEDNLLDNAQYLQYKRTLGMPKEVQKETFSVRDFLKDCYLAGDPEISAEVIAVLEKEHGKIQKKDSPKELKKRTPAASRRNKRTIESGSTPVTEKKKKINQSAASSSKATESNITTHLPGKNSPVSSRTVQIPKTDSSKDSTPELIVKKSKLDIVTEKVSSPSEMVDSSDSAVILTVKPPKTVQEENSSSKEISDSLAESPREPIAKKAKLAVVSSPSSVSDDNAEPPSFESTGSSVLLSAEAPKVDQTISQPPSKEASKSPAKSPVKETIAAEEPKPEEMVISASLPDIGTDPSPPAECHNLLETQKAAEEVVIPTAEESTSEMSTVMERSPEMTIEMSKGGQKEIPYPQKKESPAKPPLKEPIPNVIEKRAPIVSKVDGESTSVETAKQKNLATTSKEPTSENSASNDSPLKVSTPLNLTGKKSPSDHRRKRPERSSSSSSKESSPELTVKKAKKDDSLAVKGSPSESPAKKKETPRRLREPSIDVGADKMEKKMESSSVWISEKKKKKELEKKRRIVGEQERERIAALDALEELEEQLKQKKKKKKERESRESRDSDSEDSARKEKRHRKSLDRSVSPEISFKQREKEQEANRLSKKVASSSALFANSDIFDSGSAGPSVAVSAAPVKNRPSTDGSQEARIVEASAKMTDQPQAIGKKKGGCLSINDLTKIRKMRVVADREKQVKEMGATAFVLPSLTVKNPVHSPKIPAPPPKKTEPIAKKAQTVVPTRIHPLPPKKKNPPVLSAASSGIDLMESIVSNMDKVRASSEIPFSPGPAPFVASQAPVIPNSENLLLKTASKPKKDFKIPSFNYEAHVAASSSSSSSSNVHKKVPPIVISRKTLTGAAESPLATDNDSETMADFEPSPDDYESSPMDVDGEPVPAPVVKAKAPKDKEEENNVSVACLLAQPFYPTYRHRLLKDLGLLKRHSYTTDDLPLKENIIHNRKARYWEDYDKVVVAGFTKLRKENLSSIQLQFSSLKIHVPMVWNKEKKIWKRTKGNGDEVKQALKEIRPVIKTSPPKVFKVVVPVEETPKEVPMDIDRAPDTVKQKPKDADVPERPLIRREIETGLPLECYRNFAIDAYMKMRPNRLSEILSKISSALQRLRLVEELLSSVIPNVKGEFDLERPWIAESESCRYDEWWHQFHHCCISGKHFKCRMLGAMLSALPEKMRFHSKGPFNPAVVMHCMKFGSFCQKTVLFEFGVPRCLHEFLIIPKNGYDLALESIHIILCQTKPWQIVELLRKGHCVNSLIWRHLPPTFESDPETVPIPLADALTEIIASGVPLDPQLAINIAKGMSCLANCLQNYMAKKIDSVVKFHFQGFKAEPLTPVHTVVTTGSIHTANAFTYLIDGKRVWRNLIKQEYGGIGEEDIEFLKKKETFVVVTVARVQFIGGVQISETGRRVSPLDIKPFFDDCTKPVTLSLCATSVYTPRPFILLDDPQVTKDVDTWFFVIPPNLSHQLLKMVKHRIRLALDTEGSIGVKFLVQMHMLDKPHPDAPECSTSTAPPTVSSAESSSTGPSLA